VLFVGVVFFLYLMFGGSVLSRPASSVFFLRTAASFLAIGYLTHLTLDARTSFGLPLFLGKTRSSKLPSQIAKSIAQVKGLRKASHAAWNLIKWTGLAILTVSVVLTFWSQLEHLATHGDVWKSLLCGIAIGAACDHYILHRRARGIHTFIHEVAHAVAALLLGHRVNQFIATRDAGGLVSHSRRKNEATTHVFGGLKQHLIALAPYFWPTLSVFAVLLRPLIAPEWFPVYDVIIGATIGFHLMTSWRDLRLNSQVENVRSSVTQRTLKSDIAQCGGLAWSSVCITIAATFTYSIILSVILHDHVGLLYWGRQLSSESLSVTTRLVSLFLRPVLYVWSLSVIVGIPVEMPLSLLLLLADVHPRR